MPKADTLTLLKGPPESRRARTCSRVSDRWFHPPTTSDVRRRRPSSSGVGVLFGKKIAASLRRDWRGGERVSRQTLQNFEPPAWASYSARDARLAASSRADGARMRRRRGVQGRVLLRRTPGPLPVPPGWPAASFDLQRSDAGIAVFQSFRTVASRVNVDLPNAPCGCSIEPVPARWTLQLACLPVRTRPWQVAPMSTLGRCVALATDYEARRRAEP